MKKISEKIHELKKDIGLIASVECSAQELKKLSDLPPGSPLPDGITYDYVSETYVKEGEVKMTAEEKQEFFALQKLSYLKSIKTYLRFFYVLALLSLIPAAIGLLILLINML